MKKLARDFYVENQVSLSSGGEKEFVAAMTKLLRRAYNRGKRAQANRDVVVVYSYNPHNHQGIYVDGKLAVQDFSLSLLDALRLFSKRVRSVTLQDDDMPALRWNPRLLKYLLAHKNRLPKKFPAHLVDEFDKEDA